jgi:hypothetical protein
MSSNVQFTGIHNSYTHSNPAHGGTGWQVLLPAVAVGRKRMNLIIQNQSTVAAYHVQFNDTATGSASGIHVPIGGSIAISNYNGAVSVHSLFAGSVIQFAEAVN